MYVENKEVDQSGVNTWEQLPCSIVLQWVELVPLEPEEVSLEVLLEEVMVERHHCQRSCKNHLCL